jgi:hypothetical protein
MREATNLSWTGTPFGGARRPFADRTSLLAAFSVTVADGSPAAATAVYLPLPRAHSVTVTDTTPRFGFHAIAAEEQAEIPAVLATVDALLVQARRQAAILAGHQLAGELAALTALSTGQPLRGITAVGASWHSQPPERGLARLHDTGSGPAPVALADVCASYHLHGLPPKIPPTGYAASWSAPQILRRLVARALAIALIAARHAGRHQWDALHLDTIVEAAAWDQLTDPPIEPAR